MSNENCNVEVTEHKCLCQTKWFRKFLLITFGSFLGVFLALSLFAALHKPPMMVGCPCGCPMMRPMMHHQHFDRDMGREFHKKMPRECGNKRIPVKVEIED